MNGHYSKSFLTVALIALGATAFEARNCRRLVCRARKRVHRDNQALRGRNVEWAIATPAAPQTQSIFSGSVPGKFVPGVLQISLQDAIDRGLKQNLGALLSSEDMHTARGKRWQQLSELLPHVTRRRWWIRRSIWRSLASRFRGANIPTIVGPFSYFDARAYLSQQLCSIGKRSTRRARRRRT